MRLFGQNVPTSLDHCILELLDDHTGRRNGFEYLIYSKAFSMMGSFGTTLTDGSTSDFEFAFDSAKKWAEDDNPSTLVYITDSCIIMQRVYRRVDRIRHTIVTMTDEPFVWNEDNWHLLFGRDDNKLG